MPALPDYFPKGHSAAGVFFIVAAVVLFKTAWGHSLGMFTSRGKYDMSSTILATRHENPIAFGIRLVLGYGIGVVLLIVGIVVYVRN